VDPRQLILRPGQTGPVTQPIPTVAQLFELQRRIARENLGVITNGVLPRFLQNDLGFLHRPPELYLEDDVKMVYIINDALAGESDAQGNPLYLLTSLDAPLGTLQTTITVYTVPNNRKTRLDLVNGFVSPSTSAIFNTASNNVGSAYYSIEVLRGVAGAIAVRRRIDMVLGGLVGSASVELPGPIYLQSGDIVRATILLEGQRVVAAFARGVITVSGVELDNDVSFNKVS